MFFFVAKIAWLLIQPLSMIILLVMAAFVTLLVGWRWLAFAGLALALAIITVSCFTTAGVILIERLEAKHARPALPDRIAGIVVLGGQFNSLVSSERGVTELSGNGKRYLEAARLARQFPEAKLILTGGSGELVGGDVDLHNLVRFMAEIGVPRERIITESKARDTYENARFSKNLMTNDDDAPYLLVTSAYHMSRALPVFRALGVNILPWPADYKTSGTESLALSLFHPLGNLNAFSLAMREIVGSFMYRLVGRY